MNTDENFNEFYSNTLSSKLITLDKLRLAMKKKNFFVFLIHIAIPFTEKLFEPKYHRSIVNDKKTVEFFKLLKLLTSIIEELNLNTRIWTKQ